MKRYIGYFDYLGFRKFIENNNLIEQRKGMNNLWRDIEDALTLEKKVEGPRGGLIGDFEEAKINCINFSDTVVYFTDDASLESLEALLEVAYIFNYKTNGYFFPARGALVHGDLETVDFTYKNSKKNVYNINSVYGQGLISAYEKAESQDWAGTVIDQSFIKAIELSGNDPDDYLKKYAIKYNVPYKGGVGEEKEYVLKLVCDKINQVTFENWSIGIKRNFEDYKKGPLNVRTTTIYNNTIQFLKQFLDVNL